MRHAIVPAVAAAIVASTGLAQALPAFNHQDGKVQSIDTSAHTVKLDDGQVFHLPGDWNAKNVAQGDEVRVWYNIRGGQLAATEVDPMKSTE